MTSHAAFPFAHVPPHAGDPILSLMEAFQADPRPHKASLGIGIYMDDGGRLPCLESVRQAETRLAQDIQPRPYLPMEGLAAYRGAVQRLLFGADSEALQAGRIATVQTVGGTGALKLGADFLHRHFPAAGIWVSDPTWDNHHAIFGGAGVPVRTYPYYDASTGAVRFDAMLAALESLPPQSIVLLHASCHNPTGVDLSPAQWEQLIPVLQRRELLPFVDIAYQGFGAGLQDDAFAVRALAAAGLTFLVANSFSKNFSLYGERVGGLSVVCADRATADTVLGQLKSEVRGNYGTPPVHGARVVTQVLEDPELFALWTAETDAMRRRIRAMREQLHAVLHDTFGSRRSFAYLLTQRGMFSYTGLDPAQVDRLREDHGVYLIRSGRLCLTGLTTRNVAHVARCIAAVVER
ncbi:MAG: aromatic amino acid aminotransferase [Ramlibacter sp.]|uniref:amino acid aminotransferase n=1 Tax=Ramlibacter sp. TaxID=1917967 RepID=UPI0026030C96|nr:amino acid aminotransferase [Ramlibacter sp.]MDB5751587.1 aromatic amino acid aminotransferase [Ramlibacter sp.]